ncbi:MAG: general secretion pathway protein GspK [Planctomycetes bacterium]|nr:general secretion pathway protein GspK [Planctomycetota bacterium]
MNSDGRFAITKGPQDEPSTGLGRSAARRDRGIALIIVLFLSAVLTTLMYAFLAEMRVEYSLADGFAKEKQARHLAWSAIEKAAATLEQEVSPVAGPASAWYDNPAEWYEIELGAGVYSMIHATLDDDGRMRFGLADESAKININVAPREVLLRLPRMTEEVADSIIDWRDPDDQVTGSGAESSYYQGLSPGYRSKNAPFETVEELLLVKGMTPEILYGEDLNQNGVLDAGERDGTRSPPDDNADSTLDFGLIAYVTVYSYDRNVAQDGSPRVNVNTATPEQLRGALGDVLAPEEIQRIVTQRAMFGGNYPTVAHLLASPEMPLVGLPPDRWKRIVDRITTRDEPVTQGLLNINTAGRKILQALPGLDEQDVAKIVEYRTRPGVDLSTLGWLADVLPSAKIQAIAAGITARAYQFRFDAVGRVGPASERAPGALTTLARDAAKAPPPARPMRRIVAVYDRGGDRPRFVYVRDVSRLGMPYVVEEPEP